MYESTGAFEEMIVKYVKGDLVTLIEENKCEPVYVAHGCNCFVTQGGGIAQELRKFPEIYQADIDNARVGDKSKLGTYSVANVHVNNKHVATVFNMYTQFGYGVGQRFADYDAIREGFHRLNSVLESGSILYIPRIGAGLAGGDWDVIKNCIDCATPNLRVVVVDYVKGIYPL